MEKIVDRLSSLSNARIFSLRKDVTGLIHEFKQSREFKRFRDTPEDAFGKIRMIGHIGIDRHQNNGGPGPHHAAHPDKLQAVKPRHVVVHQHGVIPSFFHLFRPSEAVGSRVNVIAVIHQAYSSQMQDVLIVIDDQRGFPYPSISHPPALQRRCRSFSRQCYLAQDQAKNSPPT